VRAAAALAPRLEPLYVAYNRAAGARDPIELVRPYAAPEDREVAAFIASGLAFGNVRAVMQSVRTVLEAMGPSPAAFVRGFEPRRDARALETFGHRWIRGRDIAAMLWALHQMLATHGSLERCFLAGDDPEAPDVTIALESFSTRALALDYREVYGRTTGRPGVAYFFARPSTGSACKRLNLFLRWMVRRDAVDLGVWTGVAPARLVVPLDVHIVRLSRCLRLTRYSSPGWRMAAEITASLRRLDPMDPVRFDFSLCHLGMQGACGFGRRQRDRACPLRGVCHPGAVRGNISTRRPRAVR